MSSCPTCGAEVGDGDQFCEACGATIGAAGPVAPATSSSDSPADATHLIDPPAAIALASAPMAAPRRCSCGGEVDADGWCTVCGLRASSERDHTTQQVAPNVAGVCDKGLVHPRNEDAMALAASAGRVVIVVCDGVSSSTDGDVASLAAANAACAVLSEAQSPSSPDVDTVVRSWTEALGRAAAAAQGEAADAAVTVGAKDNPPSCTFVSAVVDGPTVVAGWVGDSRCYFFGDDGSALQLSSDDSWAGDQIAQGASREAAEADPRAHSITRWLGADSPGGPPNCSARSVAGGGWLLVCTDGLWNYCSAAPDLGRLVVGTAAQHDHDPLATASALCDWANEQGGHDNVTAVLAHLAPVAASVPSLPTDDTARAETRPVTQPPA